MDRIIITGASDGLAKQLALKCLENNIEVIALCRRKPDYKCNFIKTDLMNLIMKNHADIINVGSTCGTKFTKKY